MIPSKIVPSVTRCALTPRQVTREFDRLIRNGAALSIAGKARRQPGLLFDRGLKPKHKIELFDTVFYLTNVRQIPELRFLVGFVLQEVRGKPVFYPRIIYKDLSLAWRSASHFSIADDQIWVGKGDVRIDQDGAYETVESIEATTDLPLEIQTVVETLPGYSRRAANGDGILELVLRQSSPSRVEPFADFTTPRIQAQKDPRHLIHRGRAIARFRRRNDPRSLEVVKGYEPDFSDGILERSRSRSRLYGGVLRRFRILSTNRKIQYYFIAGTKHAWVLPPQATTTELSSYGVRTIDVVAPDDLFVPGYEYHHVEQTSEGERFYSQIPDGYAGAVCPLDDAKADASPWLNRLPMIQAFRREVLR